MGVSIWVGFMPSGRRTRRRKTWPSILMTMSPDTSGSWRGSSAIRKVSHTWRSGQRPQLPSSQRPTSVEKGGIPKAGRSMNEVPNDPQAIAELYLGLNSASVEDRYGSGKDGTVFASSRNTAVKVHAYRDRFEKEVQVYERLASEGVTQVLGANVPKLIQFHSELMVLEITVVKRPFVIDFATSSLDMPPDFTDEVWQVWREQREEEFGSYWPHAARIFDYLKKRHGIWHLDFSPRNVDLRPPSAD